jgi:16S rRNA (cytidine1402-2'-O)-methyltransferase
MATDKNDKIAAASEVPTLRVVCTPIGNLADMTGRAVDALKSSTVILAEDTRVSRKLLDHYGVKGRLVSCHQNNELSRWELVDQEIGEGRHVALISDAGAPGVSDPGSRLVDRAREAGIRVEVLPGPSAIVAAVMGAGIDTSRFAFFGFLPRKGKARRDAIQNTLHGGLALIFFESPNRIESTLGELAEKYPGRRVVVARELTKRFETFHRGVLGEPLEPPLVTKGEMVVLVEAGANEGPAEVDPEVLEGRVRELSQDKSLTPRKRAKVLVTEFGLDSKEAYALFLKNRSSEVGESTNGK